MEVIYDNGTVKTRLYVVKREDSPELFLINC